VRTIVVGDIHGCFDELQELLSKIGLNADDRVIAVGDLIVKGPKNREVLDLFISDNRFSSVLGNHDRAILQGLDGEEVKLKGSQKRVIKELEGSGRYLEFLKTLPPLIDLGSHIVIHAGLRPGIPLSEQSIEDLTELRTTGGKRTSRKGTPWYLDYKGPKIALFGHWPSSVPRRGPTALGLDTGCVYGNHLTAYILELDELIQVRSRRAYSL
jgi:hypothetical protein